VVAVSFNCDARSSTTAEKRAKRRIMIVCISSYSAKVFVIPISESAISPYVTVADHQEPPKRRLSQ
jgi:hypothetical protein